MKLMILGATGAVDSQVLNPARMGFEHLVLAPPRRAIGSKPFSQNRVHLWLSEPDNLISPRRARILQTNPEGMANTWVASKSR